jgi:Zn-dependent protease
MNLKIGSIPVRVQGWFILMALLLGANQRDPVLLGMWVAVVVVSVVVHELGHALIGKAFGLTPRIVLHGMGGATSFDPPKPGEASRGELSTGKSIVISLAGPFAGFLLGGLVLLVKIAGFRPTHPLALYALSLVLTVNIGWGIFNLLPMLPLDGGNVMKAILNAISKKNGERIARVISIVIAAGIALYAVTGQQWWILYLGVLFAFRNVQALRQSGQMEVDQGLADAIKQGYDALDRSQPREAIAALRPALEMPATIDLKQIGLRVYVIALIREGVFGEAMAVIERERALIGTEDLGRYAQLMRELERPDDAAQIDELLKQPVPVTEFRA